MGSTGEWTAAQAAAHLRVPTGSDDKYSRGVLGVRTGSDAYPGAAVLGVEATWRTGLGMVRYLGPDRPTGLVLARRPETVTVDGRVQAWLIGSGTDAARRTPAETDALRAILRRALPVIVDAGALDLAMDAAAPLVVTPHAGEHARLRRQLGLAGDGEGDRLASAAETAAELGATVLLKGAETVVATPAGWTRTVRAGTAWLATAGTGDVLGGILGALVAAAGAAAEQAAGGEAERAGRAGALTVEQLGPLAATAAVLHGAAARRASAAHAGGPVTALDIAEHVAPAVGEALAGA
ncbi:ADP-dependent NAD(P)H-hydrate dehydratase [Microbacterium invictum]|uniref:ADP-dependent (S)-NAD(P)H-hydrate dehydratase n=1 Tax=Microbacterium invictum TaxID=515415 RepID=A0AA40VLT8_9MICO|nr:MULTISPECIES: ADP/ATP-dependent (S)-NAD(P)H-hydrate dehydratase [Microbacterium]MBB4139694.1 hydroxyethylthiazole kinase-like uncharacterized protein yjeF [Microbacterium invictum]